MVLLSISPQVQSISIPLHVWKRKMRDTYGTILFFHTDNSQGHFQHVRLKILPCFCLKQPYRLDFCVRYEISLSPIGTNWLYCEGLAILPWLLWLPKTGRRNFFLLAGRLLFQRINSSFVTWRMAHGFISSWCPRFMLLLVAYFFPYFKLFILSWKSLESINCCYFFLNALIVTWMLLF